GVRGGGRIPSGLPPRRGLRSLATDRRAPRPCEPAGAARLSPPAPASGIVRADPAAGDLDTLRAGHGEDATRRPARNGRGERGGYEAGSPRSRHDREGARRSDRRRLCLPREPSPGPGMRRPGPDHRGRDRPPADRTTRPRPARGGSRVDPCQGGDPQEAVRAGARLDPARLRRQALLRRPSSARPPGRAGRIAGPLGMKILLDLRPLETPTARRGRGPYTRELARPLPGAAPKGWRFVGLSWSGEGTRLG